MNQSTMTITKKKGPIVTPLISLSVIILVGILILVWAKKEHEALLLMLMLSGVIAGICYVVGYSLYKEPDWLRTITTTRVLPYIDTAPLPLKGGDIFNATSNAEHIE